MKQVPDNPEVDFASSVIVRLVDRLLKAEDAVKREEQRDEDESTLWCELGDLLRDEPEYKNQETNGLVHLLPVAIAVLKRHKEDAPRRST